MNRELSERYFLFIWEKDGEYKAFNLHDEFKHEGYLQKNGWTHLATIDPSLWIEALLQHKPQDALDMIQSLRTRPT